MNSSVRFNQENTTKITIDLNKLKQGLYFVKMNQSVVKFYKID